MSTAVCGWCGVSAHLPIVGQPVTQLFSEWEPFEVRVTAAHKCDHCGGLVLSYAEGLLEDEVEGPPTFAGPQPEHFHAYADRNDRLSWLPPAKAGHEFEHVPTDVDSAARESWLCFEFGALRASVQMARSVIEATAKEKGVVVKGIFKKIEEMHRQGLVRAHVKDAAHEVRELGNEMAHGDFTAPISKEDAHLVLTLMNQVLTEVFEDPGQVSAAQAARAARAQTAP